MLSLKKRWKYIALTLSVFLVNCFLDRFTKFLAVTFLRGRDTIRLFHNLIIIFYAENNGAFLSLGANWNMYVKYLVLLIIPVLICVAGLFYLMFREQRFRRIIILASVIGGGLSNLWDRLFNDFRVIDFLNFGIGGLRTGILNVADLSVTFGAIAMILCEILEKKPEL
jgi:signal peptidase II